MALNPYRIIAIHFPAPSRSKPEKHYCLSHLAEFRPGVQYGDLNPDSIIAISSPVPSL